MTSTTQPLPDGHDALVARDAPLDARDWLTLLGLTVLTCAVFANGLRGGFVLDDQKQIVRNDLIRIPAFWTTALSRDIWAFQGERETASSNYWRPGHVAWLIANYRLFGPNPFGWHLTNLLAHLGVVACAYAVLRRLGAAWGVALAIVALFAIHPTRVESVTWIAGVHDVLATLGQLVALLCLMSIWRRDRLGDPPGATGTALRWAVALVCYALAVCTKEIAILFPAIVALVRYTEPPPPDARPARPGPSIGRAILPALPFAAIGAAFLVARQLVLGRTQIAWPGQPGYREVIATLPLVVVTYLRLIVFPYHIGWSYPVRAVTGATMGLRTFYVPLAVLVGVVLVAQRLVRGRLALVGTAVFALTLLPAMNQRALPPEQIVKDRYLYMPLLGFLMVVVPAVAAGMRRALGPRRAALVGGAVVAALVLLLGVRTVQYGAAWRDEPALWQWAVWNDPRSATNHESLARSYMHAGRYDDARASFDRALTLHEGLTDAYINRAELSIRQRRFDDAVHDALRVLARYPDHTRAYERLALAREGQGRLEEAADALREARRRVPTRTALFTDKLAVILVKQGKKSEALAELESVRRQAETDFAPGSRLVLFHLGLLYHEQGRSAEAAAALRRFLELTENTSDPNLAGPRQQSRALLAGPAR